MSYKSNLITIFRHWIIRIIASGDLVVINAKIKVEKSISGEYVYFNDVDGGMVAHNHFDVGSNVIVLENNKVN